MTPDRAQVSLLFHLFLVNFVVEIQSKTEVTAAVPVMPVMSVMAVMSSPVMPVMSSPVMSVMASPVHMPLSPRRARQGLT